MDVLRRMANMTGLMYYFLGLERRAKKCTRTRLAWETGRIQRARERNESLVDLAGGMGGSRPGEHGVEAGTHSSDCGKIRRLPPKHQKGKFSAKGAHTAPSTCGGPAAPRLARPRVLNTPPRGRPGSVRAWQCAP